MKKFPFFLLFPSLLIVAFSGCRETKFESVWSERAVVVDGRYSEWTAPLQYFDRPSMYMGFRNDRDNLYIMIKTVDRRAQIKVLRLGLTVWFDPPDPKGKVWGVHYPLGMEHPGISIRGVEAPGELSDVQRKQVAEMLGGFEIREKGVEAGVRVRTQAADSSGYGVQAAVRDTSDVIVYELKVPLRGDGRSPYAAIPDAKGRVRLRFETGDIRPERWSSVREDSLRVVDPFGNENSGKIRNKGRSERTGRPRLTPPPNPITEPIRFQAVVGLAAEPGTPGKARK
jgi:hypothetical protein